MATAWLTTPPTDKNLDLSDNHFRLCLRLLLGFTPSTDLPDHCKDCLRPLDRPDHFMFCLRANARTSKVRHNQLAYTLIEFCTRAGIFAYSCDLDKRSIKVDPASNKRPNIHIIFPGEQILDDVSVAHAPAPTHVRA